MYFQKPWTVYVMNSRTCLPRKNVGRLNVYMQINGLFQKIFVQAYSRHFFVWALSYLGIPNWYVFRACQEYVGFARAVCTYFQVQSANKWENLHPLERGRGQEPLVGMQLTSAGFSPQCCYQAQHKTNVSWLFKHPDMFSEMANEDPRFTWVSNCIREGFRSREQLVRDKQQRM